MVSNGDNPTIKDSPPEDTEIEKARITITPAERVIELLENQNKILGALSQTINTRLQHMSNDVEACKVLVGKLVKMGPVEVKIDQKQSSPQGMSFPQSMGDPGPIK